MDIWFGFIFIFKSTLHLPDEAILKNKLRELTEFTLENEEINEGE